MGLKARLEEGLKVSLKAGRRADVSAIRLTLSELKSAEKDKRAPLEEKEIVQLLRSAVKKRKEAIGLFRSGGRPDLAEKEEAEVRLLEQYLPAAPSAGELGEVVEEVIRETGASSPADLGRVMKAVMARLEGRADGAAVNRLVRERLAATGGATP